jgi:hypothetical protein
MDENLRFEPGRKTEVQTIQDFQIAWVFWETEAMVLRLQKPPSAGGSMCPSYRATLEKDTTRLEPMRYENI